MGEVFHGMKGSPRQEAKVKAFQNIQYAQLNMFYEILIQLFIFLKI